jgi:hypothetical protein
LIAQVVAGLSPIKNNQMEIESKRLKLSEISWDDLEDIHHIHSFPEVDEFNTLGIPKDIEETREVIRKDIEKKDDPLRGEWKDGYLYAILEDDPRDY